MSVGILTDLTMCQGCEACVDACKEANGLPHDDAKRLSATTWTTIDRRAGLNVRRQCMHCVEPACASVCPVGALYKTELGPVAYDESRCIGCRYCMLACPFGVPTYDWSSNQPRVKKCIMCYEQAVSRGMAPACTSACPAGATIFGERDKLILEARRRLETEPSRYVPHIYGLEEVGGTSVLYLSSVPFEQLGFNTTLRHDPYPMLTWKVLSKLPNVVSVAGAGLLGIWWITKRRDDVARAEGATAETAKKEHE